MAGIGRRGLRAKDWELAVGTIDGESLELGEGGGRRGHGVSSRGTPPLIVVAYA